MSFILLISANDALAESLQAALPASTPLVRATNLAEAHNYLCTENKPGDCPALILLSGGDGQEVAAGCRQLCHDHSVGDVPIIAVIAAPSDRQLVLEAGADDYLLLPLLPAEINTRLAIHLHAALRGSKTLIEIVNQMNSGPSPTDILNRGIKSLAEIFNAPSAWLFWFDPDKEGVSLSGSYNLPPILGDHKTMQQEAMACMEMLQKMGGDSNMPQVIPCRTLGAVSPAEANGLTHHLSIPLDTGERPVGILNLGYAHPPQISRAEKRMLTILGQDIAILLEMFRLHQETQLHATEIGFMVLLARMISERLDLNTTLSLTVEQAVTLLNASGGDIWLLNADRQWLELASSLTSPFANPHGGRRAQGQGLIGWVTEQGQSLHTNRPGTDPRFDPHVDQIEEGADYCILAVPLRHHTAVIGALAIHSRADRPFTNRGAVLLEGIASLAASAIANARLIYELRDYADQQRALYEMSQQIAAGLDLAETLQRALHWVSRLSETEVSLLWLVENGGSRKEVVRPVAALGVTLEPQQEPEAERLIASVAQDGQAVVINDPAHDPRIGGYISHILGVMPRNILAVPMTYHGQVIGVLSLFDKVGGDFNDADLTLLLTAIEMIAIAVGNARLHTQTLTLMEERERLHKQILQAERLVTVGRLTASLSHEINNPMQAIQGALTLALEELDDPPALTMYLQMSLKESERVVQLVSRMRQIYRPQADTIETLDLNHLLEEAVEIARREMKRQRVLLETDLEPDLPRLTAVANQLHLVFLSLILNLSDAIGAVGGGKLWLRSDGLPYAVRVELSTDTSPDWAQALKANGPAGEVALGLGLSLSHDIIVAHGGAIRLDQQEGKTVCSVELPLVPHTAESRRVP
jgi:GAF domain-containing protein